MKNHNYKFWLSFLFVLGVGILKAQSLQHPIIYITSAERDQVLDKINTTSWGASLYNSLKSNVDSKLATHQSNPAAIFSDANLIFPANDTNSESVAGPYATAHGKLLSTAEYSAMLYFITQDEKYAKFTGDILAFYFDALSARTISTTTICGNYFYDPRKTYNHLAVAYDFVYNYLDLDGTTVYNKATNTRVAFDKTKAQKAITNIVGNALKESGGYDTWGSFISNHAVLTAPGALFPILCVENDTERERLFNIFWEKGTKRQNSFKNTILKMFGEQGIWPESTSYSFMPNIPMVLNVIDRIKPDLNAISNNLNIFEGSFLFEDMRIPDRRFVRFGDAKRESDATDNLYRFSLNVARRKGYTSLQTKAETSLQQYYAVNPYSPKVPADAFDNYTSAELFWGETLPTGTVNKYVYSPTVVIKHAGIALQRNYVDVNNNNYGLCGYIGGAHYVHSHATGIGMEIYGAGYVMGPNAGLPPSVAERQLPEHTNYFRLYAGNNTVIVNGTSHGIQTGAWNSNSYLWQNTTVNIASEPKHLEDPISKNFSFATQFLDDNVNNCDQQRTLSTIRTSKTTAYYFDIFRSKSNTTNNFHDYIYHNLGDETLITDNANQTLAVSATNRYTTYYNDPVQSPGWKFFESTQVTAPTSEAVKVRFKLNYNNRYMNMFVPGGVEREFTKALAPATREALNGYVKKKTQVIAIRQQGEAWDKPYVVVFEPSLSTTSSVKSVENLMDGTKIVGAKVVSQVNDTTFTDYILSLENANSTYINSDLNINFEGRFAIIRTIVSATKSELTLYIGQGNNLSFGNETLNADESKKGLKVGEYIPTSVSNTLAAPSSFSIVPNPVTESFTIVTKDMQSKKVAIYDITGKTIFEKTNPENQIVISTKKQNMKSGVYFVKIVDNNQNISTQKLIVK